MRAGKFPWALCVVASVMALVGVAGAQSTEPACSMGFQPVFSYGAVGAGSVPYSATAKATFEQKLGDGSYVRGYAVTHQARDGAGRTMSEMAMNCQRGEDGVPRPQLNVNVFDPVAKTSLNWQVNSAYTEKIVHVFHQPPPAPAKPLSAEQLALQRKEALARQTTPCPVPKAGDGDLGTRIIAGVEAHGERTTQTIAAGQEGNELPMVILHETWRSKELGLVVLGISDDPRRGRSTFEIQELTVGEPDAALFAPPAGYKIVDVNPPADGAAKP
jgi:hypothetical protein